MNSFPNSAAEFYRLRDDRTSRCSINCKYQNVACAVYLSPKAAASATGQAMLIVAANMLSRWCRKVTLVIPTTAINAELCMGNGDLGEIVLAQMADADPFGNFEVVPDGNVAAPVALLIGENAVNRGGTAIFINASGWLASISSEGPIGLPPGDDGNRIGAIAAACLGVAQLFKIATEMSPIHYVREGIFDMFRLGWLECAHETKWPTDLNVGKLLMIGAGSVASSAAYCMLLNSLAGTISIVDKDIVKIENFGRSLIFGRRTLGFPKANAVADFLSPSSVRAASVPLWWDEFLRQRMRSSFDFDVWLPLANEFGVRLAMQHNVPPLMIHASTGSNWGVYHGRHIPGRDDCLADRFPVEVSSNSLTCATGHVATTAGTIDAALPFASVFAGLLVVAELVRAQLPEYPQVPNFALFDWYGPLDSIQAWDRNPRPVCFCREQQALHQRYNQSTKYHPLFRFAA